MCIDPYNSKFQSAHSTVEYGAVSSHIYDLALITTQSESIDHA